MILGLSKPKDEWTMLFTPRCIHCKTTGEVRVKKKDATTWKYTSRYIRPLVQDLFPYIDKDYREQIMTGIHPRCFYEMFGDEEDDD
tara:strand:- start:33 stop:290 length:258 start_codon:yes stop_codon:yes gene_type:complete